MFSPPSLPLLVALSFSAPCLVRSPWPFFSFFGGKIPCTSIVFFPAGKLFGHVCCSTQPVFLSSPSLQVLARPRQPQSHGPFLSVGDFSFFHPFLHLSPLFFLRSPSVASSFLERVQPVFFSRSVSSPPLHPQPFSRWPPLR